MPLGKLSKRQIQSAYALLTEVQQVSVSVSQSVQQVRLDVVTGIGTLLRLR